MPPRDPSRRAQRFSEQRLDDLAQVTPEDLELAALAWRRDATGTGYERLLDAAPEGEEPEEG